MTRGTWDDRSSHAHICRVVTSGFPFYSLPRWRFGGAWLFVRLLVSRSDPLSYSKICARHQQSPPHFRYVRSISPSRTALYDVRCGFTTLVRSIPLFIGKVWVTHAQHDYIIRLIPSVLSSSLRPPLILHTFTCVSPRCLLVSVTVSFALGCIFMRIRNYNIL